MRTLTAQQKKALASWFRKNYPDKTGHYKFELTDKMDYETYNNIDEMHPTEIFKQNADHYLETLVEQSHN